MLIVSNNSWNIPIDINNAVAEVPGINWVRLIAIPIIQYIIRLIIL